MCLQKKNEILADSIFAHFDQVVVRLWFHGKIQIARILEIVDYH